MDSSDGEKVVEGGKAEGGKETSAPMQGNASESEGTAFIEAALAKATLVEAAPVEAAPIEATLIEATPPTLAIGTVKTFPDPPSEETSGSTHGDPSPEPHASNEPPSLPDNQDLNTPVEPSPQNQVQNDEPDTSLDHDLAETLQREELKKLETDPERILDASASSEVQNPSSVLTDELMLKNIEESKREKREAEEREAREAEDEKLAKEFQEKIEKRGGRFPSTVEDLGFESTADDSAAQSEVG